MTYRLLVLACSDRKKAGPEWLEAIERYDGPVWQSLRAIHVPKNVAVMALSARYGLFRSWRGQECIRPDAWLTEATGMIGRMRETMLDWICESPRISRAKLVDFRARKYENASQRDRISSTTRRSGRFFMATQKIKFNYGSTTGVIVWDGAHAEAPIQLDGVSTGFCTADARHRTADVVRLVLEKEFGDINMRDVDYIEL